MGRLSAQIQRETGTLAGRTETRRNRYLKNNYGGRVQADVSRGPAADWWEVVGKRKPQSDCDQRTIAGLRLTEILAGLRRGRPGNKGQRRLWNLHWEACFGLVGREDRARLAARTRTARAARLGQRHALTREVGLEGIAGVG